MPSNNKEYFQKYYNANKQKFKQYAAATVHCDKCNKTIRKQNYNRHCRSKKHNEKQQKDLLTVVQKLIDLHT